MESAIISSRRNPGGAENDTNCKVKTLTDFRDVDIGTLHAHVIMDQTSNHYALVERLYIATKECICSHDLSNTSTGVETRENRQRIGNCDIKHQLKVPSAKNA